MLRTRMIVFALPVVATLVLSSILASARRELSDVALSRCRGGNQQFHNAGCASCASSNLPPNTIDECACAQNPGAWCLYCDGFDYTSINYQQGHVQGDPGWLAGNYYACSGGNGPNNKVMATCQGGACVGVPTTIGQCWEGIQEYEQEGGGG
jgi:hypothetical protein